MTLDSSKYSADYYLEDYQKKLRENQTNISSNIDVSSDNNSSHVDFGNDSFPDLSDSMSHVENRLISQFREYKEIKKKLDDAKRELHLSTQMQVSVDNFKELERAYIHRKNTLDDKFREANEGYHEQIKLLKNEIDIILSEKNNVLERVKQEEIKALESVRISFEQNQLVESELFYHGFLRQSVEYDFMLNEAQSTYENYLLELEKNKENYKAKYESEISQMNSDYEHRSKELRFQFNEQEKEITDSIELLKFSYKEQVDDVNQVLAEQYQCLNFEYEQCQRSFHMLTQQFDSDFQLKKKQSMDVLLEFSEQIDQKRGMWEFEKVNVLESIDQEKFKWDQEKNKIIQDLDQKRLHFDKELEIDKARFIKEKDEWTLSQEVLISEYEDKKESLANELSILKVKIDESEAMFLNYSEKLESYELMMYERDQEFELAKYHMLNKLESERKAKLDSLELEFVEQKNIFSGQLKQLEDRQKLDFSERLDAFEKDLSQRRRLFEEDLLTRRQKIIEECKRDQKIEFDHLLEFEKSKYKKQQGVLQDQIDSLKADLKEKDSYASDQLQEYQDKIKDLNDDNARLALDLTRIEDLTRKKTIGSYEEKFKKSIDHFKDQSQKEIQKYRSSSAKLDSELKKKELEVRNYQLQIKRLEAQLNKQMLFNKDRDGNRPSDDAPKIVRSNNFRRGI
jgi:hypothetical protein